MLLRRRVACQRRILDWVLRNFGLQPRPNCLQFSEEDEGVLLGNDVPAVPDCTVREGGLPTSVQGFGEISDVPVGLPSAPAEASPPNVVIDQPPTHPIPRPQTLPAALEVHSRDAKTTLKRMLRSRLDAETRDPLEPNPVPACKATRGDQRRGDCNTSAPVANAYLSSDTPANAPIVSDAVTTVHDIRSPVRTAAPDAIPCMPMVRKPPNRAVVW